MTRKKEQTLLSLALVILFIGLLMGAVLPAPVAEAGLPNRDTPTPVPHPDSGDDKKDNTPVGAWIALQVSGTPDGAPSGAWSVVQWQNSAGNWEIVEGWQGTLDPSGGRRWWVAEKDFGDGPFRWVITQGKDGPALGTSQAFNLPDGANETVQVTVSLAE
jgi:hypothetical protein